MGPYKESMANAKGKGPDVQAVKQHTVLARQLHHRLIIRSLPCVLRWGCPPPQPGGLVRDPRLLHRQRRLDARVHVGKTERSLQRWQRYDLAPGDGVLEPQHVACVGRRINPNQQFGPDRVGLKP